ncbi:type II toxin-antitoxin system PemK/MazF family toxin [Polymorphospora sp. NPDC051019]|uniref:type II toxin-antitoxin system PemK/MazF family toxin n=1 Tax=Polymorphospora sp. NPDC051019 TaxID=3155725 RepID=UPI003449E68E
MTSLWKGVTAKLGKLTGRREAPAPARREAPTPGRTPNGRTIPAARPAPPRNRPTGEVRDGRLLVYAPQLDGQADPGEIVWTWVPYEDDPRQGKDRPVLVVGRKGATLLGLMLSSQDDRDGQRHWFGLGPGAWDRESRPSWVRLDRVIEVDEDGIRREGAILDRRRFDLVAAELRRDYGWN